MDAYHQDQYAERQRGDFDAGGVAADADGDYDAEDYEADDVIPVEVVKGPGAGAAERSAGGGFLGEADRADGQGVEAYDAEDWGEDGEDVGCF